MRERRREGEREGERGREHETETERERVRHTYTQNSPYNFFPVGESCLYWYFLGGSLFRYFFQMIFYIRVSTTNTQMLKEY